ncbi:hypothetical protein BaRGS_00036692, partial [Batillaria attramentaria]
LGSGSDEQRCPPPFYLGHEGARQCLGIMGQWRQKDWKIRVLAHRQWSTRESLKRCCCLEGGRG